MKSFQWLSMLAFTGSALAASSWSFDDGQVSIHNQASTGRGFKEKITAGKKLGKPVIMGPQDTLKVQLTAKDGKKAAQPHQLFLQLKDPKTDLETSFPLAGGANGKGKLELSQKEIPTELIAAQNDIHASFIIASFGKSKPYFTTAFDLKIERDPTIQLPYIGKFQPLPEIHHIFKADPTSPPKIITAIFVFAVVACLPVLFLVWGNLGANFDHLNYALEKSPIAHVLFFTSILALEGVFFLYYTHWKLYQALPAALGIGVVTVLSGTKALREVQARRLAGLR